MVTHQKFENNFFSQNDYLYFLQKSVEKVIFFFRLRIENTNLIFIKICFPLIFNTTANKIKMFKHV